MKAKFLMDPFPHVLLEDFLTEGEWKSCMIEIHKLDPHLLPPEYSGTARDKKTGRPLKYNSGLFLSEAMPNSELISHSRRHMFQDLVTTCEDMPLWWEGQWRQNNHESWMLSRYVHGQYYNAHVDLAQFTLLMWLHHEPKPFTGGDLIFADYDNYTVPCNNNTGIIFYGPTRHEVPPVDGNGRYTLTCFTGVQNPVLKKTR